MAAEDGDLRDEVTALRAEVDQLKHQLRRSGVRRRSSTIIMGLPLYEIATGPDPDRGETRGHARAVFAIGDKATGIVAIGRIARGVIAIGGGAIGIVSIGGGAIGLLLALGGGAVGGLAVGGAAIGLIAIGGMAIGAVAAGGSAIGYYAYGDQAIGQFVVSQARRDPEAVRFFGPLLQWFPLPRR